MDPVRQHAERLKEASEAVGRQRRAILRTMAEPMARLRRIAGLPPRELQELIEERRKNQT